MTDSFEVVVLRQVDVGEADRIVSLLTAHRGRLDVRVPRVRKSRKRFGGMDLFVRGEVSLQLGRRTPALASFRLIDGHPGIREDLERLALAGHAAELLLQAVPEDQEAGESFLLATRALQSLDRPAGDQVGGLGWARAFELKLLHVLGNRPVLRSCVGCGEPVAEGDRELAWSSLHGGVLSGDCRQEDPAARRVSIALLQRLDQALHLPMARQVEVCWSSREREEAGSTLWPLVATHVGTWRRARTFLEGVLGSAALVPLLLALSLVGCLPSSGTSTVGVQGFLYDTRTPEEEREPISEAELSAWNDAGELLAEGAEPFSDYPGWYRVLGLPPSTGVHLEFISPGAQFTSSVLSGRTAEDDLWVDPGTFHIFSADEAQTWLDEWTDALAPRPDLKPSYPPVEVSDSAGIVRGRLADPEANLGLRIVFLDASGASSSAVYTDEDGHPSLGTGTSAEGGFAAFGLQPGPVEVMLFDADGTGHGRSFLTRASPGAITSLFDFEVLR